MKIGLLGLSIKPVPPLAGSLCAPNDLVCSLAEELVTTGHEVVVFSGQDANPGVPVINGGLKTASAFFDQSSTDPALFTQKRAELDLMLATEAIKAYKRGDIEVVNCHDARLIPFIFEAAGIPALFTVHGDLSSHQDIYETYRYEFFAESKLAMTAMSKANERFIKSKNIPYAGYAPNGINIGQYPFSNHERRGILVVARMIKLKKIKESIEASLDLGEEITLIGPAGSSEEDKSYFRELEGRYFNNPKVHYLGYKQRQDILPYYQRASVLLFLSEKEGMPMAILEAMSTGLPVAASDVGGVSDLVVDGQTGALINEGDDLAAKIITARNCNNETVRNHIEVNFSIRAMAENYFQAYERFLKGELL